MRLPFSDSWSTLWLVCMHIREWDVYIEHFAGSFHPLSSLASWVFVLNLFPLNPSSTASLSMLLSAN